MRSLSRLLLLALLSVVLVGGAVSGLAAYRAGLIEVGELFDAKLAHSARTLRALVDAGLDQADATEHVTPLDISVWSGTASGHGADLATATGHGYETKLAFQAWSADGRLLLRSDSAPTEPLAPLRPGFHERIVGSHNWRSFVLRSDSGRWYVAGEREDVRADISADIALGILAPLLIELPISAVLIWVAIGIGRRALRRVVSEVRSRAVDRLQPLVERDVPEEVFGLVQAINRLLAELDTALQRERRFTADAAHELRTPLAALRVQLANLREAADSSERIRAEQQLERGLMRLERLMIQLLTLSRLEPGVQLPEPQQVDLAELVRDVIAELVDAGQTEGVTVGLRVEGQGRLQGDPLSLSVMSRNLIENAARYAPAPGVVQVIVSESHDGITLQVEDSGPGVPEDERQRVFDRFYRRVGSGVDGSGLGLSIAQRVAQMHGATLTLDRSAALGGLSVSVHFPATGPGKR